MNTTAAAELIVRELEPASFASIEASKDCNNEEIVYARNALIRRLDRMTGIISRGIEQAILEDRVAERIGVTHRRAWVCDGCGRTYLDRHPGVCDSCGCTTFYEAELSYRKEPDPDLLSQLFTKP